MSIENKSNNHFATLDTIRVFAGLLVFLSHYSYHFKDTRISWVYDNVAGVTGKFGVVLFFFISGFLALNSLKKQSFPKFYIKKYVSVISPYIYAYIAISFLFFAFSFFNPKFFYYTPLNKLFLETEKYLDYIPLFFGIDGILNSHWDTKYPFLVGEWFIGSIIFLYILAPLLYLSMKKGWGIYAFLLSLVLSVTIFFNLEIKNIFWFFLCRLPEFFAGMLFCFYFDKIILHKKKFFLISIFCVAVVSIASFIIYPESIHGNFIIPMTPRSFLVSFCYMIIAYLFFDFLNERIDLGFINQYAKYLYAFIIIHHVILNQFMVLLPVNKFGIAGYFLALAFLLTLTMMLAKHIKERSGAIEKKLINLFIKK